MIATLVRLSGWPPPERSSGGGWRGTTRPKEKTTDFCQSVRDSPLHIPRSTIIAFIEGLRSSPYVDIVHIDARFDEKAWQLLKAREDKRWSLVDCASFVVVEELGITEALTSDHHFE